MSQNHRSIVKTAIFLLAAGLVFAGFAQSMRNITTQQLVRDMGNAINLGNTFEATCDWNAADCWIKGNTVNAFETAWGSPTITKAMIEGYKSAGFKTVRIPVAWSNLMTGTQGFPNQAGNRTYTISTDLLNRVQQVVGWVLESDMYAIVNVHWDGGWWTKFPTDSAECMKKYTKIWEQVGTHFRNYSDYVMFESLNEEGKWQDVWNMYDNSGSKTRAYGLLNAINQQFVNIIRGQGGNNANRHLLIAGYDTNIDRTIDAAFRMPNAPGTSTRDSRCAVSVHYYDPFGFTHLEKAESWAPLLMTWGTTQDRNQLTTEMNKLKTNFVDKGIPVIVGEYGFASDLARDQAEIRKYTLAVCSSIYVRQMLPVLWDVQRGNRIDYYNRNTRQFADAQLVAGFKSLIPFPPGGNGGTTSVENGVNNKVTASHPALTVKGKTLNVSSPANTDVRVRVIDVKGKVRANFSVNGNGSYSMSRIPAGRYFVEVRGAGVRTTSPIILK